MAFAAITFKTRPGTEGEVVRIFQNFKRAGSPVVPGKDGRPAGLILGTALFLKDDTLVRVIQYEGDLDDVARYMSTQDGVREAEARLGEYLVEPRDSSTLDGFMAFFRDCAMRPVQQAAVPAEAAAAMTTGDVPRLLRMIEGFAASQLVAAMARLRLADHLAGGPRTAADLAATLGAGTDATARFLRAAAATGLVAARPPDRFAITSLGALLASGEGTLRNYAMSRAAPAQSRPWERVAEAVITGGPTTESVLGTGLWEYYRAHPDEGDLFAATMTDLSEAAAPAVIPAYDFAAFACVVDIGGGYAALLTRVLEAAPGARGVLFDQPEVIERAREIVAKRGLGGRVDFVAGSFLARRSPAAATSMP